MLTQQKRAALIICVVSKEEKLAHMDSQMARRTWTVWLVHFAKRSGGKLATFTVSSLFGLLESPLMLRNLPVALL